MRTIGTDAVYMLGFSRCLENCLACFCNFVVGGRLEANKIVPLPAQTPALPPPISLLGAVEFQFPYFGARRPHSEMGGDKKKKDGNILFQRR